MLLTTFLLGLLYVVFAVVLFNVLNVGLAPMLLIVVGLAFFQYFTSDKIALAASGAKVVTPEQAPELHAMPTPTTSPTTRSSSGASGPRSSPTRPKTSPAPSPSATAR